MQSAALVGRDRCGVAHADCVFEKKRWDFTLGCSRSFLPEVRATAAPSAAPQDDSACGDVASHPKRSITPRTRTCPREPRWRV
jgi:hypothetical protein